MGIYLGSTDVNMFGGQPVQGGGGNPQTKSVTPTESAQSVYPDAGYYLSRVDVGAIDSEYVGSDIPRKSSSDLSASGATVTAPSGYYASSATKTISSGSAKPASSISSSDGATITTETGKIVLSKTVNNVPQVTAGYISSGTFGDTSVTLRATCSINGNSALSQSGNTVTALAGYYPSNATITVSGGGANKQIYQGYAQRTGNGYDSTSATLTVAVTGTYKVSWTAWRSSSSGTMGTNLHVNDTTGTNQQTFTGTYGQRIELTNQHYNKDDVLTVYATSGSSQRSIYVANLIIEQTG